MSSRNEKSGRGNDEDDRAENRTNLELRYCSRSSEHIKVALGLLRRMMSVRAIRLGKGQHVDVHGPEEAHPEQDYINDKHGQDDE
jgi:hypothetical protein